MRRKIFILKLGSKNIMKGSKEPHAMCIILLKLNEKWINLTTVCHLLREDLCVEGITVMKARKKKER